MSDRFVNTVSSFFFAVRYKYIFLLDTDWPLWPKLVQPSLVWLMSDAFPWLYDPVTGLLLQKLPLIYLEESRHRDDPEQAIEKISNHTEYKNFWVHMRTNRGYLIKQFSITTSEQIDLPLKQWFLNLGLLSETVTMCFQTTLYQSRLSFITMVEQTEKNSMFTAELLDSSNYILGLQIRLGDEFMSQDPRSSSSASSASSNPYKMFSNELHVSIPSEHMEWSYIKGHFNCAIFLLLHEALPKQKTKIFFLTDTIELRRQASFVWEEFTRQEFRKQYQLHTNIYLYNYSATSINESDRYHLLFPEFPTLVTSFLRLGHTILPPSETLSSLKFLYSIHALLENFYFSCSDQFLTNPSSGFGTSAVYLSAKQRNFWTIWLEDWETKKEFGKLCRKEKHETEIKKIGTENFLTAGG